MFEQPLFRSVTGLVLAHAVALWLCCVGASTAHAQYLQQAKLTPTDATVKTDFGASMAAEGATLVVGAAGDRQNGVHSGAVYVYDWTGTAWGPPAKLAPDAPHVRDRFGASVALSRDTLLVGADLETYASVRAGAAYVFVREGGRFRQQARLVSDAPEDLGSFGMAVAIHGDFLAVAEPLFDGAARSEGRVLVFTREGDVWTRTAELHPSQGAGSAGFGSALALGEHTLIVGAPDDNHEAVGGGAVYVFERTDDDWALEAKLLPAHRDVSQRFGQAVDFENDVVLVGAPYDKEAIGYVGATYVFERQGSSWEQKARLLASELRDELYFGGAIDLQGNRAVISATGGMRGEIRAGAAYVFLRTGNTWLEQSKLNSSDGAAGDRFGDSLVRLGNQILVGAPNRSDRASQSGAVYSFLEAALRVGDPCQRSGDCPTGYCVDGVCCAELCSGGALDCRACSAALTGQANGVCARLAAGSACGSRDSAQCNAADSCSAAGECQANLAADGTACEAGAFCSVGDACVGGACVEGRLPRCFAVEKCDEEHDLCSLACGDGTLDDGEQCDEGVLNSDVLPDACRSLCRSAHCGDGVVDSSEQCDGGATNSDITPNACRSDCRRAFCGDGVLDSGEGCDDGAQNGVGSTPTCRVDCVVPSCGDGVQDDGEACDDGPRNSRSEPDACRPSCVLAYCGDGVLDRDEECEPALDGAACDATCRRIVALGPEFDASMPTEPEDAGMLPEPKPEPTPELEPEPTPDGGHADGTPRDGGGCAVQPGAGRGWLLLCQLAGLACLRIRSARRARRAGGQSRP